MSKRAQKYELGRSAWSIYANFEQIYDQIGEEMEDSGVATKLNEPVWMDKSGEEVDEDDFFDCKVTRMITRPDMCLVVDEVGGNTNQKGDGNVGGELQLCESEKTPQQQINIKYKHYILLGLTVLTGKPVMCVVIFSSTKEHVIVETGLDLSTPIFGSPADADFFEKNSGKGKRFPGGPTCEFKGNTIPCLYQWSKKGSITAEILQDILATLDHMEVFDRSTGSKPFLLLDRHRSRLEYSFLEYISNPNNEWVICIGVPYGAAVWQIGDSSEQNGSYNMASVVLKREIINAKDKYMCNSPTIDAHEIIEIINYAWSKEFARAD